MTTSSSVLEIALFLARDGLDPVWGPVHQTLAGFSGYETSVRLRSPTTAGLRVDLVAWNSIEFAQAAAEALQTDPRFSPFLEQIESVQHFGHYRCQRPKTLLGDLSKAPLVEVALYPVQARAEHEALHGPIHEALGQRPGALAHAPLVHNEDTTIFGDLIGWQNRAAFEKTGTELNQVPKFQPFFANVQRPIVFELFEVVP